MFNCSFQFKGLKLNESLLLGPVFGPSLFGVFFWFRERAIDISGNIKEMFHHQVHLSRRKPTAQWQAYIQRTPKVTSKSQSETAVWAQAWTLCCSHWCPVCQPSQKERTIPISQTVYWTDSMTMLNWLQLESCRFYRSLCGCTFHSLWYMRHVTCESLCNTVSRMSHTA